MICDFLMAALIAALAGMGVGGGGLLVIWLVLVRNTPAQAAQGINLLFFIVSALCALPLHWKRRRIPYRYTIALTAAACPGVLLGCHLVQNLSETLARKGFGIFLLLSGVMMAFRQLGRIKGKKRLHADRSL